MKTLNDYKEEYNKLKIKKNMKGKEALEAVKQNAYALPFVIEQTEEICLEAVKQNGNALQYVAKQTEEICLEAVKQDGYALQFVKEQTEKICLEAVKQNGLALQHVVEQTEEICLEAVKEDGYALQFVSEDMFTKEEDDNELRKTLELIKGIEANLEDIKDLQKQIIKNLK